MATLGRVYNLHWACHLPSDQNATPAALTNQNTLDQNEKPFPGVILFPSLCTPLIIVAPPQAQPQDGSAPAGTATSDSSSDTSEANSPDLAPDTAAADKLRAQLATANPVEVLLLTKSGVIITVEEVNRRLKITLDDSPFKATKRIVSSLLFDPTTLGNTPAPITVTQKGTFDATTILETDSGRFRGLIDVRVIAHYANLGYTIIYSISADARMLAPPQSAAGDLPPVPEEQNHTDLSSETVAPFADRPEDQDKIVFDFAQVPAADNPRAKQMQYAFTIMDDDVAVGTPDPTTPVIAFHPVFFYTSLAYANLGHVSDIHCGARQQILKLSSAHVIESGVFPGTGADPVPGQLPIGKMINVYSRNCLELLKKMGSDAEVDVIVIGGDLIDHASSALPSANSTLSVRQVWDLVDCDTLTNYFDNPDLNTFYSMLVYCMQQAASKPIFAVTGNHDAYKESYGISPRFPSRGGRRNEGIPADHNLTIYEAILCFGKSFGTINAPVITRGTHSSFDASRLKWFYMVFTPFSDFTIELPNQKMVCLGWGDDERLVELFGSGQGHGHLPRASSACNQKQLELAKNCIGDGSKKIILTTHFTFLSYDGSISNSDACKYDLSKGDGAVKLTSGDYTMRDMGTFEKNRSEFYNTLLLADPCPVQVVLTGHSHRRGLHTIRGPLADGTGIATCMYDFPVSTCPNMGLAFDGGRPISLPDVDQKAPYIILSDCAGPIPRRSLNDEFKGYGSDRPAGTRILFDSLDGSITKIEAIQVEASDRTIPRFAVAIDYLDLMGLKYTNDTGGNPMVKAAKERGNPIEAFEKFKSKDMDCDQQKSDFAKLREDKTNPDFKTYQFEVQLHPSLQYGAEYGGISIKQIILYACKRDPNNNNQPSWNSFQLSQADDGFWNLPNDFTTNNQFRMNFIGNSLRETFAAIYFAGGNKDIQAVYDFETPWTFEVKASDHNSGLFGLGSKIWITIERDSDNKEYPDFDRRAQYPEYKSPVLL